MYTLRFLHSKLIVDHEISRALNAQQIDAPKLLLSSAKGDFDGENATEAEEWMEEDLQRWHAAAEGR